MTVSSFINVFMSASLLKAYKRGAITSSNRVRMNVFNSPQEKGVGEWKSVGAILREKRADLYPGKQKVVHLNVRHSGRAYHQQFFILKNAR